MKTKNVWTNFHYRADFPLPEGLYSMYCMLFLCSGSPETEFSVKFFSPSQKSGREKHGKQINKQTNLRKFRECLADFLHEVTNLSQWSQIIEKTNEFSTVGGFSLTFPTLGYQSVTHYIPESFHYPVILWAIHSFNINIHESKNQLHMILSMIFLINIRKNVN